MTSGPPMLDLPVEESALLIGPPGREMLAVLTSPAPAGSAKPIGVVIVVGGPQTRVGAHRQFVSLARALAAAGHPCLRFDYTGMGDSPGPMPDFERAGPDIGRACKALQAARPDCQKIALWGLCDGATAALLYAAENPDIAAVIAANPWARSEATRAQTMVKTHYGSRLKSAEFWKKLASGKVDVLASAREAVQHLVRATRPASPQGADSSDLPTRLACALARLGGRAHLQLSGRDLVASEFKIAMPAQQANQLLLERAFHLIGADHTFSNASHWEAVVRDCVGVLRQV